MWPFEQTIAMQGTQPLTPAPTQDPNEIATRTQAFLPFVQRLQQGLQTPQGQMAALMVAQQMLAARAPGESNGALPRLVDGALQGMGAIAQFNANQQTQANKEQEMQQQADQLDVQRRGQDVTARGQDLQAEQSANEIAAANARNADSLGVQRFGIEERAKADAADAKVRQAGVNAQVRANELNAQNQQEELAIKEREILATSEAARLKYGLDKDEGTTKLITEATKAAVEASSMGQGTFDVNFRNIYNNMAAAAGKKGIAGNPPTTDQLNRGLIAVKKAVENNIDPNSIIDQLALEVDRKYGIDGRMYAEELRKQYAKQPAPATASAAPSASGGGVSLPNLFDTTPAPAPKAIPPEQEIADIQKRLAADDNIKSSFGGSLGRAIQTKTMPLSVAERKALENRLKKLTGKK